MKQLKVGDTARFKTSCGQEITGTVVQACKEGYVVAGDNIKSNLHDDGLFRFTLT